MRRIFKKLKKRIMEDVKWKEHRAHWGKENPECTFYVMRRYTSYNGIGSHILVLLGMLRYMENKYPMAIPVVDFKNYKHCIAENDGTNAWEKFFEQPNDKGWTVEKIEKSKNVILANGYYRKSHYELPAIGTYEQMCQDGWEELFRKYIRLQPQLRKRFQQEWEMLRPHGRVLGIKCRGTDYLHVMPKGHCVQPSFEQLKQQCDVLLSQGFTHVFFATEDEKAMNYFQTAYKEKLFTVPKKFYDYKEGIVTHSDHVGLLNAEITENYLRELYFLSQCDGFLSGKNSGVFLSIMWNEGKYRKLELMDLGVY